MLSKVLPSELSESPSNQRVQQNQFGLVQSNIFNAAEMPWILRQIPERLPYGTEISGLSPLYRASQNKFDTNVFHGLCDQVPYTLVFVKTSKGQRFGGYTPCKWSKARDGNFERCSRYQNDMHGTSFLFSFDEYKVLQNNYGKNGIFQMQDQGPVFGGGYDLLISNHADRNKSTSRIGHIYRAPGFRHNDPTSYQLFCGSADGQFLTEEWEVFQVKIQSK